MSRSPIAVSFSINGGLSAETSPIKWEKPQFFLRFSDCIAQSCGGELEVAPYFDSQDTNNGAMLRCAPLFSAFCSKKMRPGESKITGAHFGHGAMARGRA